MTTPCTLVRNMYLLPWQLPLPGAGRLRRPPLFGRLKKDVVTAIPHHRLRRWVQLLLRSRARNPVGRAGPGLAIQAGPRAAKHTGKGQVFYRPCSLIIQPRHARATRRLFAPADAHDCAVVVSDSGLAEPLQPLMSRHERIGLITPDAAMVRVYHGAA